MIDRYKTVEMSNLFEPEKRFEYMLKVELAVAKIQAADGLIPKRAYIDFKSKAKINVKRISEIEKTTQHDVIAFVSQLAEIVGPNGRYIHYGLTSSDVLDSALSLQIFDSYKILLDELDQLFSVLNEKIELHRLTLCPGRTHGIYAEPTSFGFKMAGFVSEFRRVQKRLIIARDQFLVLKLSGAVGTSSFLGLDFEKKVAHELGLNVEPFATQVVPRDRHAEVFVSLGFLGSALERLSVELRHLQRSEVSEVIEGFTAGQKGSSAMPHKKNPISAENISGLSRLLKSFMITAFENIPLWHERDISHSSNERIMFPDAFILSHYLVRRMTKLVSHLFIDKARMKKNTFDLGGVLFSSHALLFLVDQLKCSREEAYEIVQSCAHSLKETESLQNALLSHPKTKGKISKTELSQLFSGKNHLKQINSRLNSYQKYLVGKS